MTQVLIDGLRKKTTQMKRRLPFALALVVVGLLVACSFFGQRVTIAENERGVVADEQGELQILAPGAYTLSPFMQSVEVYSLADQTYTMKGQPETDGVVIGNDAIETRSKDGRQLWIDAAVTFRFVESKLIEVRRTWQGSERFLNGFIRPATRNIVYSTAFQFSWEEATSSKRGEFETAVSQKLAEEFSRQGVELAKFSLLDVRGE